MTGSTAPAPTNSTLARVVSKWVLLGTVSAGVTLIAFHDCRPLVRGHGARAGVREEVNQDIIGRKEEKVVIGGA